MELNDLIQITILWDYLFFYYNVFQELHVAFMSLCYFKWLKKAHIAAIIDRKQQADMSPDTP